MSSLDLDEFLRNIKKDFLTIIDSKNDESVQEFNKIQSLLEFDIDGNPLESQIVPKKRNVDEISEMELNYDWLEYGDEADDWEDSNVNKKENNDGKKGKGDKNKVLKTSKSDQPSNIVEKVTMSSVVEKMVDNELNIDKFLKIHDNLKL